MEEISYEHREHIEQPSEDRKFKVTTLVKVQKKRVLTNSDIEARKGLKKFGQAAEFGKGVIEPAITIDDKEVFLLPFGEEKSDESISKFVSTRNHREKFEQLKKKEKELKEGKLEVARVHQQFSMEPSSFCVKVSNVPIDYTQQELEYFFAEGGRPRKVYRPLGRDTGIPRDFALINYATMAEAKAAILRFNNKACGYTILNAEHADKGNQSNRPFQRPFIKK